MMIPKPIQKDYEKCRQHRTAQPQKIAYETEKVLTLNFASMSEPFFMNDEHLPNQKNLLPEWQDVAAKR